MRIVVLLENRTVSKAYEYKHGLSLYIETDNHKLLFDTGSDESFINNAGKMGINLSEVDTAVISHGHYDHGGGLEAFMNINKKAKIYIGREAFRPHLLRLMGIFKYNIGINNKLNGSDRFVYVDDAVRIDEELVLFGKVDGDRLIPEGNKRLLAGYGSGRVERDDFSHEINLVIYEKNKHTLVCGCAHRGIVNIVERAKEVIGGEVDTVIGGMHLMSAKPKRLRDKEYLDELASMLVSNAVKEYYTCHCTGERVYNYLSSKMSNLKDLRTGMDIII
jgi:7,8-dihydropterin-6-yl-methyl-4-(beta-D-ribofuranosyl)aminobenzene 5'-phosphate synthase